MIEHVLQNCDTDPHKFSDIEKGKYFVLADTCDSLSGKILQRIKPVLVTEGERRLNAIDLNGEFFEIKLYEPVFPAHPAGKITFKIQRY